MHRPKARKTLNPSRRTCLQRLMAVAAVAAVLPASAQTAWPERSLTLVVPFPPGGVADTVARPVAEALARELKQTVVVENRVGAGGAVGNASVARAAPDGHTLLMSLSSIAVLPEADRLFGRRPAYTLQQLRPIARFTADPTVLVVRAETPWKTLADFVAAAKARPGAYNYGSSGNYGTMHVPMEMLKAEAGFSMTHIPYTGAGPAVLALLGGQVDAVASGPATVAAHIKAGKLRALAHWGEGPLAALPEVPSLRQLGVPAAFAQWAGLFVPAGTPEEIVQKLRAAARRAAQDPAVQQTIVKAGSPVEYLDAPEFAAYIEADARRLAEAVNRIGKVE